MGAESLEDALRKSCFQGCKFYTLIFLWWSVVVGIRGLEEVLFYCEIWQSLLTSFISACLLPCSSTQTKSILRPYSIFYFLYLIISNKLQWIINGRATFGIPTWGSLGRRFHWAQAPNCRSNAIREIRRSGVQLGSNWFWKTAVPSLITSGHFPSHFITWWWVLE